MPEISKPTSLNTIWAVAGDKIKFSDDKIQQGYIAEIPTAQGFNWLENRQDQFNAHVNQHGIPVWDAFTEYQAGKSYTQGSDGEVYFSKVTSLNQDPVADTSNTYWDLAFVTVNGNAGGKRYIGFEVFSSNFNAVPNHKYYLNAPLTVQFPVSADVGDAIVIAKNPLTTVTVNVNGSSLPVRDVSESTYIYTISGWVDVSLGNGAGDSVSLSGLTIVTQGSTATYTITDYNSFSVYSVASSVGTISRTNETVTLVVPNPTTAPQITLTVTRDGSPSYFVVAVGAQSVVTPTLLYPSAAQNNVELSPTLAATPFATAPAGQDTHQSSQWQIATDAGFTTIVFDSGTTTSNKTNISVTAGVLATGTTYYARVRYTGAIIGTSAWSVVNTFTTTTQYVVTPTVSVTGGPDNVGETPTISTGPFAVFGGTDTHVSTDWQVVKVSDSSVVWQSLGNTSNKTSINLPASLLLESTEYKARARHSGSSLGSSGWGEYTFVTKAQFFTFTPANAGQPYGGGYYAGKVVVSGTTYALVVAPKTQGGQSGGGVVLKTTATSTAGTGSINDGVGNTNAMIATSISAHPAAAFCDALVINGYNDWYLPSKDELEICYRYLKPTTETNFTGSGVNNSAVPTTPDPYTPTNPLQSPVTAFKLGGAEALDSFAYWTSTETTAETQWIQVFNSAGGYGTQGQQYGTAKNASSIITRAVRRVAI